MDSGGYPNHPSVVITVDTSLTLGNVIISSASDVRTFEFNISLFLIEPLFRSCASCEVPLQPNWEPRIVCPNGVLADSFNLLEFLCMR